MFLSGESLSSIKKSIFIDQDVKLSSNSFVLSLGNQVASTSPQGKVRHYDADRTINIEPGQLAYLLTKESVDISGEYMAFISLDPSLKFRGLDDVSGFHVSPGYAGKLIFAVSNESTKDIVLQEGDKIFRMWIARLDKITKELTRSRTLKAIPSDMLSSLSDNRPNVFSIDARLSNLEQKISNYDTIAKWLIGTVAALLVGYMFTVLSSNIESKNNPPTDFEGKKSIVPE